MKVLFDTNVVLKFITRREDRYREEINAIMQECHNDRFEGFIAFHSLSIIWYLLRLWSLDERVRSIELICDTLKIAHADNAMVRNALQNTAFTDFEDNLQDCCAQQANADYIVTGNVKDYAGHSVVPAITPAALLALLADANAASADMNPPCELRETHIKYQAVSKTTQIAAYHTHALFVSRHRTCTFVA